MSLMLHGRVRRVLQVTWSTTWRALTGMTAGGLLAAVLTEIVVGPGWPGLGPEVLGGLILGVTAGAALGPVLGLVAGIGIDPWARPGRYRWLMRLLGALVALAATAIIAYPCARRAGAGRRWA